MTSWFWRTSKRLRAHFGWNKAKSLLPALFSTGGDAAPAPMPEGPSASQTSTSGDAAHEETVHTREVQAALRAMFEKEGAVCIMSSFREVQIKNMLGASPSIQAELK